MAASPSSDLAPDLARLRREEEALCLAARVRPTQAAEARLAELLAGGVDWDRLWRLGHVHEVVPLVSTTIGALGDRAAVPAEWQFRAQRRRSGTLIQNTAAQTQLLRVLDGLDRAGVAVMPVKGLVVGERYYGSIALRPARDVDVLVHPADLPAARAVLVELGFRQVPEATGHDAREVFHDPPWFVQGALGEVCLELHWALWSSQAFGLEPAALWARSRVIDLFDRPIQTLDAEDTLLHLAIHRARSSLRLRWLCDIAELVRVEGPALDGDRLRARADAAGARTALGMALELAGGLLGAPLAEGWAAAFRPGPLRRRLLDRTCGVAALFSPEGAEDEQRQPHVSTRVLEQDGTLRVGRALAGALVSRGLRRPHARPG